MKKVFSALMLILAAIAHSGCGYALAGRGSFLPTYIQAIGIPTFVNNTPYYEIEQILSQKVRSEFIGRGKYRVLPSADAVDAVLEGQIIGLTLAPASFNENQQASRYIITLSTKMEFRDLKTNTVLWQNPALIYREEYEATNTTDVLDPTAFFGQEANAIERLSTEYARTLVSAILEAF